MTRHLTLTAIEAQAFAATPVGETFWLVREGDTLCGALGPIAPAEFVQVCAFCNACDARLWDHGQNRKTDCPDCRIELVGPCPICSEPTKRHPMDDDVLMCYMGTVTLGHAYAEGHPLPISDVWPDKPPADGLMFLPTGRAAYHKASRPTFWLPGQSKGTEFSLRRLAHYGPPETLVGQWAIALRKVQS